MAVAPEAVKNYGLTALPASADAVLPKNPGSPTPYPVSSTPIPPSPLAERVQKYARENLPRLGDSKATFSYMACGQW